MIALDVKQERKEFDDWADDNGFNAHRNYLFECWLAAKRASMGSGERLALKDAPKRIYLVIEDADGDHPFATFRDAEKAAQADVGLMWCVDRQGPSDIQYVRSDLYAPSSADAKDADRYRWLRDQMAFDSTGVGIPVMSMRKTIPAPQHNVHSDWIDERFDASVDVTIDAAMQQGEKR